jgi:hypothetical protein
MKKYKTLVLITTVLSICFVFTLLCTKQSAADEKKIVSQVFSEYFKSKNVDYNKSSSLFQGDDALTASFIISKTGANPVELRSALVRYNNNWLDVMVHYGMQPTALFLPVPPNYHVGPPYGKAYGYWKKHKHNPKYVMKLTNQDINNLIYLNVLHNHFGTPVVDLMRHRQAGHSFTFIINNEHQKRMKNKDKKHEHCCGQEHSKGQKEKDRGPGHGQGKGKGQEKGKK